MVKYSLFCISLFFVLASYSQKSPSDFVFTIKTDNRGVSNDSAFLFRRADSDTASYSPMDIDWDNDGLWDSLNVIKGSIQHQYDSVGVYTVRVRGNHLKNMRFSKGISHRGDRSKLISIDQWGDHLWEKMSFVRCDSLVSLPLDTPDLSNLINASTSMMFYGCSTLNSTVNHWDMSNIMSTAYMFADAVSFNQPLDAWDVSSVINMRGMFLEADSFNQSLDSWDVSSVEDMSSMFDSTKTFNQPLNNWNVSSVKDFSWMFYGAIAFNQPLGNWDVSSATNFQWMFDGAYNFDQDLYNWQFDLSTPSQLLIQFVSGTGLSRTNYERLLNRLNQNQQANNSQVLGAIGLIYCDSTDRNQLVNAGWFIAGDAFGLNCGLVGIKERSDYSFSFYPNPATSILEFENSTIGERLKIFNLQGQLLEEQFITQSSFTKDLSSFENGIYLIRIGEKTEKLIIQK